VLAVDVVGNGGIESSMFVLKSFVFGKKFGRERTNSYSPLVGIRGLAGGGRKKVNLKINRRKGNV